jgi:hypothetical protein
MAFSIRGLENGYKDIGIRGIFDYEHNWTFYHED